MTLAGKTALVTGGSRGIGRAVALELARRGADVVINYVRHDQAADEVVEEILKAGGRAVTCRANVGAPKEIEHLVEATPEFSGGPLDVLIHNAALGAFKPALELRNNQFNLAMDINAKALLWLSQMLLSAMSNREGRIIALTSHGSHRVVPDYAGIGVSKAALESLVRYLAVELASAGIRVNSVNAGVVDTDAIRSLPRYQEIKREAEQKTPLGRLGTPEDIACCVAMLCGPEAGWITGQTVVADGGLGLL